MYYRNLDIMYYCRLAWNDEPLDERSGISGTKFGGTRSMQYSLVSGNHKFQVTTSFTGITATL